MDIAGHAIPLLLLLSATGFVVIHTAAKHGVVVPTLVSWFLHLLIAGLILRVPGSVGRRRVLLPRFRDAADEQVYGKRVRGQSADHTRQRRLADSPRIDVHAHGHLGSSRHHSELRRHSAPRPRDGNHHATARPSDAMDALAGCPATQCPPLGIGIAPRILYMAFCRDRLGLSGRDGRQEE